MIRSTEKKYFNLGKWSEQDLDALIGSASQIPDTGQKITALSREFLDIPYRESTLKGDVKTPETFVVNLEGVDCFTFIDYVEAMSISASYREFIENLRRVRYQGGTVDFKKRNHFFSDWVEFNGPLVKDVTCEVGGTGTLRVMKELNAREDGTLFLPGLKPHRRQIDYIPGEFVDNALLGRLIAGDYIGIYTDAAGLDVSHVGIFVIEGGRPYLRHASSAAESRMVLDQDFTAYVGSKPGIVILRSVEHQA
jgi:hypothetical protein